MQAMGIKGDGGVLEKQVVGSTASTLSSRVIIVMEGRWVWVVPAEQILSQSQRVSWGLGWVKGEIDKRKLCGRLVNSIQLIITYTVENIINLTKSSWFHLRLFNVSYVALNRVCCDFSVVSPQNKQLLDLLIWLPRHIFSSKSVTPPTGVHRFSTCILSIVWRIINAGGLFLHIHVMVG